MKLSASFFTTFLLFSGLTNSVFAGNQREEALANPVRLALAKAFTDHRSPKPSFRLIQDQVGYLQWLAEMSARLQKKIPHSQTRIEFLETTWYEAKRAGLDPGLVLGLIQVESAFRKYAVSVAGARGFMQVMPFWSRVIGDNNAQKLFHMSTNLRYGCSILRMYLDMEGGNLFMALGRYNGSRGQAGYPDMVLNAWKKWEYKERETGKKT